jgi:hypothetical protein
LNLFRNPFGGKEIKDGNVSGVDGD